MRDVPGPFRRMREGCGCGRWLKEGGEVGREVDEVWVEEGVEVWEGEEGGGKEEGEG